MGKFNIHDTEIGQLSASGNNYRMASQSETTEATTAGPQPRQANDWSNPRPIPMREGQPDPRTALPQGSLGDLASDPYVLPRHGVSLGWLLTLFAAVAGFVLGKLL